METLGWTRQVTENLRYYVFKFWEVVMVLSYFLYAPLNTESLINAVGEAARSIVKGQMDKVSYIKG